MYCIVNTNAVDICTEDCHTHVAICCWQFSQISTSIFHKTIRNSSLLELSKMLLYWQNSVHKVNVVVKKEKKQTGLFSFQVTNHAAVENSVELSSNGESSCNFERESICKNR